MHNDLQIKISEGIYLLCFALLCFGLLCFALHVAVDDAKQKMSRQTSWLPEACIGCESLESLCDRETSKLLVRVLGVADEILVTGQPLSVIALYACLGHEMGNLCAGDCSRTGFAEAAACFCTFPLRLMLHACRDRLLLGLD